MPITAADVFTFEGTPSPGPDKTAVMDRIVLAVEQHYADNYLPPMNIRDVYGVTVTAGSPVILGAFVATDDEMPVFGNGIACRARITSVVVATSATLDLAAVITGRVTVTVGDRANPVPRDPRGANVDLALTMMAHRLSKRPASPEGIAGIAEFGPVRISRFDSDVHDRLIPKPLCR